MASGLQDRLRLLVVGNKHTQIVPALERIKQEVSMYPYREERNIHKHHELTSISLQQKYIVDLVPYGTEDSKYHASQDLLESIAELQSGMYDAILIMHNKGEGISVAEEVPTKYRSLTMVIAPGGISKNDQALYRKHGITHFAAKERESPNYFIKSLETMLQ